MNDQGSDHHHTLGGVRALRYGRVVSKLSLRNVFRHMYSDPNEKRVFQEI